MILRTKIIGFTGLSGSGKSYAASIVKECYPSYRLFSFARQIKRIAFCEMGWDQVKDDRGRKLLQDIGMAGRAYDPKLWINFMHQFVIPNRSIIIDDVRFLNEAEAIRKLNGIVIRVKRFGVDPMDHVSETEQEQINPDFTLINDGSETFKHILLHELKNYGSVSEPA
jgi:hypothetical protein